MTIEFKSLMLVKMLGLAIIIGFGFELAAAVDEAMEPVKEYYAELDKVANK